MSEERITLEEAMEAIDNCLTEKFNYRKDWDEDELLNSKDYHKYERNKSLIKAGISAAGTAAVAATLPKLKKELSDIKNEINKEKSKDKPDDSKIKKLKKKSAKIKLQMAGLGIAGTSILGNTYKNARWANLNNDDLKEIDEEFKRRASNVKESVDALRLRCHESCEAGFITEQERDTYLDYLDLDNYTEGFLDKNKVLTKEQ